MLNWHWHGNCRNCIRLLVDFVVRGGRHFWGTGSHIFHALLPLTYPPQAVTRSERYVYTVVTRGLPVLQSRLKGANGFRKNLIWERRVIAFAHYPALPVARRHFDVTHVEFDFLLWLGRNGWL